MTGLDQVLGILARYDEQANHAPTSSCACYKSRPQESVTVGWPTAEGHVCSDCYFEIWGELVEEHSIPSPKRR
jgi:hypothetical protein